MHATTLLIEAEGQSAVTPTRLVQMTGIARSTIYRHWPDSTSIIADALAQSSRSINFEPTGNIEDDLRLYLFQLRDVLESPKAALLATQIELAEHDPEISNMLAGVGSHRSQIIQNLLNDNASDFSSSHAMLVGPLFSQRFFLRQPITDQLIDRIVTAYLVSVSL